MFKNKKPILIVSVILVIAGFLIYSKDKEDSKNPPSIIIDHELLQSFSKKGEYNLIGWDDKDSTNYNEALQIWLQDNDQAEKITLKEGMNFFHTSEDTDVETVVEEMYLLNHQILFYTFYDNEWHLYPKVKADGGDYKINDIKNDYELYAGQGYGIFALGELESFGKNPPSQETRSLNFDKFKPGWNLASIIPDDIEAYVDKYEIWLYDEDEELFFKEIDKKPDDNDISYLAWINYTGEDGVVDCAGVPNGSAYEDQCGVCDDDPSNDNADMDCAGVCGGSAVEDQCGVCDGPGPTGCDNACGSTLENDECGVCDGPGPTYQCSNGTMVCDASEPECAITNGCDLPMNHLYVSGNDVMYNIDTDIAGFQFNIDGANVTGASGGDAEAAGFTISHNATTVIGYSLTGSTIPAGCGTLVSLSFSNATGEDICIGTDGEDPAPYSSGTEIENGDLNQDNINNVLDLVLLINCIQAGNCQHGGDLNNDGKINVVDIVTLVNYLIVNESELTLTFSDAAGSNIPVSVICDDGAGYGAGPGDGSIAKVRFLGSPQGEDKTWYKNQGTVLVRVEDLDNTDLEEVPIKVFAVSDATEEGISLIAEKIAPGYFIAEFRIYQGDTGPAGPLHVELEDKIIAIYKDCIIPNDGECMDIIDEADIVIIPPLP